MANANYVQFNRGIQQANQAKAEEQKKQTERQQKLQDTIMESVIENKLQEASFQRQLKQAQALPKGEGYSWTVSPSGGLSIKYAPPKEKKETSAELFRSDLQSAKGGELPWETLRGKYPESSKQKEIEKLRTSLLPKIGQSPTFQRGTGGAISNLRSKFSRNVAEINKATNEIIGAIKTQEDLDRVVRNREFLEPRGIDVNAILEYFNQRGKGNTQINFSQIPGQ